MGAGASAAVGPQIRKVVDASTKLASKFKKKKIVRRDQLKESPSILRVEVHQAKNLPAKDDNGLSDPYICLYYGSDNPEVRTDVRHKTLTPLWNQTLDFAVWKVPPEISGLQEPRLTIKCWDWEESGLPQYMGSVDVDVDTLELDGEPIHGWYLLEDPAEPEAFGEVEVTIRWITRPNTGPDAIISVNVLGAQELAPIGSHGFVDPYVKVTYSGDAENPQSTDTRIRTMDPMWRQILEFPARSGEVGNERVDVHVYHRGTLKDKLIGWYSIELAGFNFEKDAVYYDLMPEKWRPDKKLSAEDDEDLGRIHVQVKLKKKRNVTVPDTAIRITIMEAKKLPPRARADTCDPYVQVEFEKAVKKTQVRFKQSVSSCPEWSETFVFDAWSDRLDSSLLISVMDHQEWRKDKVIGAVPINLLDYNVGDFYEEWKQISCPTFPESQAEIQYQIAIRNKPKEKEKDAALRVRVIEAKNLPAMDWGGTSDPYIVATFEGNNKRTATVFKTLAPVWNELISFPTKADEMDNLLTLECFDQDFGGKDDACGKCEVDLSGLGLNNTIKEWLPLRDIDHPSYEGQLCVEIVLMAKAVALDPDCSLEIKVVGCKDIIAADAGGTSDPYVVIDFDNKRSKTGTRFKTLNPIFDEQFRFLHHSSHIHELIRFEVIDYDLVGANQPLGFVYLKVGDLKIDQQVDLNLNIRLKEDEDPTGELNLVVLLKRLSEFTVNLMPRSKSMDTMHGFQDLSTGVAKSEPIYTLKRCGSLASSGLVLDFESTNPLRAKKEGDEGFVDELHEAWVNEQEKRRQFDLQYASELRNDQVENNLKRGRNANGRCAFCGNTFSVIDRAVQCQVDKFWYHSFGASTVRSAGTTCFELHKEPLKIRLKREMLRESEKEEEMYRRVIWDRDHEREKAAKANRGRLKKAVMARDFSKFAKRTRQGLDEVHNPPFATEVYFDRVEYEDFTRNSKQRRRFLQQLREDVASVLNISDAQVTVPMLDAQNSMVVLQISDDPEGHDRWTPEQLAKRLVNMITGARRNQRLYSTQVLVSSIKIDLKGPVMSPVAAVMLDHTDVQVIEKAKFQPRNTPDQAGRLPCFFYICSDYDDMKPERDFLAQHIFPAVDQWCAASRAQLVPVDLRHGVTRPECYHANVVATHLDEIDRCFPFFACMLGESYGWIPDDYFLNYGQLDEPRFAWLKEMPDSMSLTHIEIVHAYFRKKLDGDDPGGGRDDDFCLFYFRDKNWMNDPSFITDYQVQAANMAAEKRKLQEQRAAEAAAARELEEMSGNFDLLRVNSDFIDVRVMEGFDLGYWLDQKKNSQKDDRKKNLRKNKKVSGGGDSNAKAVLSKIGHGALLATKVLLAAPVLIVGGGVVQGVKFFFSGRQAARLSKKAHHKAHLEDMKKGKGKGKKGEEEDDTDALYEDMLRKQAEDEAAKEKATKEANGGDDDEENDGRQAGVELEMILAISFDDLQELQPTILKAVTSTSNVPNVEVQEIDSLSTESVKVIYFLPTKDFADAKKMMDVIMLEDAQELQDKLKKAKVTTNKPAVISVRQGEAKNKDDDDDKGEQEDEEDEEDEDEEDGEDDDDDPDAIRKELQAGLEHKTIRQVQPKEEDHEQLVRDLKNVPKNLPPAAKVDMVNKVYRGKWWTGERMQMYFQYIKDDVSRAAVLAGPTVMYRRCMDADSGGLSDLIAMIEDKGLQQKTRDTIEKWENESKSRGAVKGSIEHHEEEHANVKKQEDEGEGQGEDKQEEERAAHEGADTAEEEKDEAAEGDQEAAEGDQETKEAEEGTKVEVKPKPLPTHRRTVEVSRLKAFKSTFRYQKWSEMTVNFEKDQPWLIIARESLKLNLRSYNLTEWEDVGEDPDWGQADVLGEDWESPSKGAHCIRLNWNGLGWDPAHREMTILFGSREERDKILRFMNRHVIAWCKLAKFPDGSEKVYLDSMGLGFKEYEPEWVEPPAPTPRGDGVDGLPSQDTDVPPGGGDADGEAPQDGSQEPNDKDAQEEEDKKPVERKPYKEPKPRNFGLEIQVWSPIFKKWVPQEGILYCLEVKEACQSNGQWTEDLKVPEVFGALELWEQGSISKMRSRWDNIQKRVKSHAESIRDRVVNHYRWEGQGLALIADQHGFSKQLVDYYTRQPVWDYAQEGAYEQWNLIMKDAVEVSERALAQGVGVGLEDKDKAGGGDGDEDGEVGEDAQQESAKPQAALQGENSEAPPPAEVSAAVQGENSKAPSPAEASTAVQGKTSEAPPPAEDSPEASAGAPVANDTISQDAAETEGSKDEKGEEGVPTEAQGSGADATIVSEKDAKRQAKQEARRAARRAAGEQGDGENAAGDDNAAQVVGGHFGADTDETKIGTSEVSSGEPGGESRGNAEDGDGNASQQNKTTKEEQVDDDDDFLAMLESQHAPSRPTSAGRPKSAKSTASRVSKGSINSAQPGPDLPILYLHEARLLELVSDKDHNPIRLDDHETFDVLWSEEAQTLSQLQEILSTAVEISRELYDNNLVKRTVIQSQGTRYLLVGTMKDFDNPNGRPSQLLDPETEAVAWDQKQFDAEEQWAAMTKHARIVGTHKTALRMLFEFRGTKIEVVEQDNGKAEPPKALMEQDSKRNIWTDSMPDAITSYDNILQECDVLGRVLVKWIDEDPPPPPPVYTTIDLVKWQCECVQKDKIVFSWLGSKAKNSTPHFGSALQPSIGKKPFMPQQVVIKTSAQERDEWFKVLRAASIWARNQEASRQEWIEMSGMYSAQAQEEDGGFVLASTFVKKTEDQLDPYREWIFLILDHPQDVFGWTSKSKQRMQQFKTDLVAQISEAIGLPEDRLRVQRVLKANKKKSWVALESKSPAFYLAIAKKNKHGGVVVEMVIEPDVEGMERLERKPDSTIKVVTSKEAALSIVKQCHDAESTLRNTGNVAKTLMHGELKFPDDDQDDMRGDPIWVEMQFGGQKVQTKVKGSHSANFNEVFRLYLEPEDLETGIVYVRIYTTRTFGGKQLLGRCKFEISPLVPNTVMPLSLTPEENEHGMLVLQVKLTPRKEHVIAKKTGPYRKPILTELPTVGLKSRHLTENARAEQRLIDLKAVLCIETNVYQDYPALYDGIDALGRVKLTDLVDMGDRMADDIFACLKGYGLLKMAMERPLDMLSIERSQHEAYRKTLGYVCAGRYETLEKAQQFVSDGAPNTILVIAGKPGTGKSNVMACLHKMFAEGHRVLPNPHTKTLQLDAIAENAKAPPRGHSWARPEVVSIFMGASNGNTTPRYLLYLLMSQLAEILRVSRLKFEASEHKQKVVPADPSQLFPIPHEYNKLRLQFITLCQNIDKFVPHRRVLILIDQIDAIEGMRFDWLPVDMPKSFRLIISCGKGNMIKKMAMSTKSLQLDLLQLQPFGMRARKEMVHHLLRRRDRSINMEQMDALVLHEGANMPDYLHLAVEVLAGFKREMRFAMPVIKELEQTSASVTTQVLERMEDYCGRNLVQRCLGLMLISMYGLQEYELRMILACDALADEVSHRLKEQNQGTAVAYPYTRREDREKAIESPHALLPMSLWSPLSYMLKPFTTPSHHCQAFKYQFLLKSFENTVAARYGLETEDTRVHLHKKIAAYYRARADPELKYTWRSTDYRAAQSLIYHKIGAHDWNSVTTVLTDLGFLEYCVSMGQVHGLCTDLKMTISALDSVGIKEGADMQKMQDLMQLSFFMNANAQLLLDYPSVFVQTMANEPPTSPVAQIALQRIQGGWEGRNWFKRLQRDVSVSANTRTMRGHKGWIRALAVTLDAKYLVSGADDKTARFWSVDSGALIHLLTGHREAITAVDVSSNGLYLITSSMDASVKLWDIRSGIELANLYVGSAATSCKFSHDASLILAGTLDSTIHLFDMRTFQELHVMRSHRLGIRDIVFSKDSTQVLSGGSDGLVMMWNLAEAYSGKTGKNINAPNSTLKGHTNGVRALAWNPRNANQAVSGGDDYKLIVWNLADESITRTLVGHSAPVLSLCFTPSGAYCISSSHDSSLIVWDPNLDEVLFRFWGHEGPVYAVVVSVDEYTAMSAGADSTIRTWDVRGLLREDPDEPHILSKEASTNALKDETKPVIARRQHLQYGDIYCLAYSPAGDVLLSGSQDTSYALRSIEDGETIGEPRRGHAGPVYTCQWHPDGVRIVTGSEDTIIKMWEASTGRLLRAFKGHEGPIYGTSFFPDGAHLLSVSDDHYIRIWDVETGRPINKMPPHLGHLSAVRCCAISPENNVFCTGGDDDFVRVWDKRSNQLIRKLISHTEPILSVAFNVDGGSMLSGGIDKSVRLWDMTGALVNKWETYTAPVCSVCFSPSGRHFVAGSRDKSLVVYSSLTLQDVGHWVCESACQSVAASSRYGGFLAAGDSAGTTYVLRGILAPAGQWRYF